jgi:diguanylate cyclase (GGDEF)-like protein/PAS domain S-box-containing protein
VSGDARDISPAELLDSLEVAVVAFDRDGAVLMANRRARDEFGRMGESLTSEGLFATPLHLVDAQGQALRGRDIPSVRTLRTGDVLRDFVMGVRVDGGPVLWTMVNTSPVRDPDAGIVVGVICTFTEVTKEHRAEEALRASEERFRLLAENAADIMYRIRVGPVPQFEYVNPAVEPVLGYTPQDFYEQPGLVQRLTHEEDLEVVRKLGTMGVESVETVQVRMQRRDGTMIWTEHRVVPLRDAEGIVTALEGIARDVTALKLKEAYLSHRALHDPLTGLPNRVLLLDRLEGSLARIRRYQSFLAVLYLDLDRFKTVNDNLGHEVGDRLLQVVAQRLQETLRPSDSVARLGGDEFAAILPDLGDLHEAMHIAERLLAAVAEPVDLGEGTLVTTVSIGVAGAGDGGASAAELLRRADFAMYTAKDRGRARIEAYDELTPADRPAHEGGGETPR